MSRWQEGLNDPAVKWIAVGGVLMIFALIGFFIWLFLTLNTASCIHGTGPC